MLCAKKVRRGGYWKDEDGIPHKCDTPLSKKQGGAGGDVPYNPQPFNPDARRFQMAESFSTDSQSEDEEYNPSVDVWVGQPIQVGSATHLVRFDIDHPQGEEFAVCGKSTGYGWSLQGYSEEDWNAGWQGRRCKNCLKWGEQNDYKILSKDEQRQKYRDAGVYRPFYAESPISLKSESFSTDSQSESALAEIRTELSKKRTTMSCVRTGLAFATFGIVLANAIVLRKHAKED